MSGIFRKIVESDWLKSGRRIQSVAAWLAAAAVVVGCFFIVVEKNTISSDDAYISYSYSRNLAEGRGLTWLTGDRVEGYTNFLWTVILAGSLKLGFGAHESARGLGIFCCLICILTVAAIEGRRLGWLSPAIWLTPAVLALNRTFVGWSTSGLETSCFSMFLVSAFALLFVERKRKSKGLTIASSLAFSATALTRPEGVMIIAVAGMCLLVDLIRKQRTWGSLLLWCVPIVIIVGGHFVFRYTYYGYLFPNTFYAKVNGFWLASSTKYFRGLFTSYWFNWLSVFALVGVLSMRDFEAWACFSVIAVYWGYVFYVGGDFLEFRLIAPSFPFLYLLIIRGLRFIHGLSRFLYAKEIATVVFGVLLAKGYYESLSKDRHHYIVPHVESFKIVNKYARLRREQAEKLVELIEKGVLPRDLSFETGGAGILPYYTGWRTLDRRGLNDEWLAHQPLGKRWKLGHERMQPLSRIAELDISVVELDLFDTLVHADDKKQLDRLIRKRRGRMRARNASAKNPKHRMRFECFKVGTKGDYLIFGTTQAKEKTDKLFGHLERC